MTGRRRRASTSSVESNESVARWRQESSVVRSVPTDLPSDDWPIFELANAVVLGQDGQTIENALLVGTKGPFIVRGDLMIDDPSQKAYLIMRVRSSIPLEIRKSALYSIGEAEDGRPLIWISGKGGWYEIDPSRAYKPMYNRMCEATTMYYTLLDIYAEGLAKKSKKGKNSTLLDELAPVFHKYAARIGDGSTFQEVIARAHEHAAFFLEKLSQNDGPIDWTTTAFYQWIKTEHADLAKEIQDLLAKPKHQPILSDTEHSSRENPRARSLKSSSVDITDGNTGHSGRSKRSQALSVAPKAVDKHAARPPTQSSASNVTSHSVIPLYVWTDTDESPDSPLQSALSVFTECFEALSRTKKGMTLSGALSRLYFTYTFPTYKDGRVGSYKQPAQEWLHYYSKALVHFLDEGYRRHKIYTELQQLANTQLKLLSYKPSDFPVIITPRRSSQPRKVTDGHAPSTPVQTSVNQSYSASDSPIPMGKRPTRTPGKSALRPISRASRKRPRNEFESDQTDSENPGQAKKSHFFGGDDFVENAMEIDQVPALDSEEDNDADDDVGQNRYDLEPIKLVIRAEKIPDSSPRGPDDTWTCDQEGCDYIVRGADEEECQDRIRQHFHDHEQQLTRVNLAVSEGARGHMPINHLLEKIKQLRGDSTDAQTQPIKRKLIV